MKSEMRLRLVDIRCNDNIRAVMRDAVSVIGAVGMTPSPVPITSLYAIHDEDLEVDGVPKCMRSHAPDGFCSATKLKCYKCGEVGHLARACHDGNSPARPD